MQHERNLHYAFFSGTKNVPGGKKNFYEKIQKNYVD